MSGDFNGFGTFSVTNWETGLCFISGMPSTSLKDVWDNGLIRAFFKVHSSPLNGKIEVVSHGGRNGCDKCPCASIILWTLIEKRRLEISRSSKIHHMGKDFRWACLASFRSINIPHFICLYCYSLIRDGFNHFSICCIGCHNKLKMLSTVETGMYIQCIWCIFSVCNA